MFRRTATLWAALVTGLVFLGVAWLVREIDLPPDAPHVSWLRPFRVLAALGFGVSSVLHLPHLVGQLLAAILLGGLLGGVFAAVRVWLR